MPCCCNFTRRDFLRWGAVAAASPLLLRGSYLGTVAAASARGGDISPANLELVTLTEDRAIITWYTGYAGTDDGLGRMIPAPADGEVHFGNHPQRMHRIAGDRHGETPYHYVELTGLHPGETYYYRAFSNGKPVPPTSFTLIDGNAVGTSDVGLATGGPYAFTTPHPPRGRFVFSIALCNDLHIGETVAGLVGGVPSIKGISQIPGRPPYPELMLRALVDDARALGAEFLLAAGDITAEAVPVDLHTAQRLLDRFGTQSHDYFVARGNHDRAHAGDAYASCAAGQWQGNDCFREQFAATGEPTYFTRDLHGLRVIGLDTYDKPGNGGDPGALSTAQLAWFRTELAREREQPTLVFGHHPLIVEHTPVPSASSTLDPAQALTIASEYVRTPGVFLHHAGHTHRNHHTVIPSIPHVRHQEVGAGKEYPGGFALLRLYTGGYALNFYKQRSFLAREWSERSRMQIFGLFPQIALGSSVSDRNVVVTRDLSGLRPRRDQRKRNSRPSKSPELRQLSMYSQYATGPKG